MRRLSVTVVILLAVTAGGSLVVFVRHAREHTALLQCQYNLKQIGLGLHSYHDVHKHFPTGTLAQDGLPPEKRFGWLIQIFPTYLEGGTVGLFDRTQSWDAPANCPPRGKVVNSPVEEEHVWGEVRVFLCPLNSTRSPSSMPELTHYLGCAGLGADAAKLPVTHENAGFFGNDRKVTLDDMKHAATTIAVFETLDGGPWTAGGPLTMRGLRVGELPYVGEGGQFSSYHRAGANVLFGDGSVRTIAASVSPRVIEAMAVLAGESTRAAHRKP